MYEKNVKISDSPLCLFMLAAPKLLDAFLAAITREYRFSATGIFFGLKVREGNALSV